MIYNIINIDLSQSRINEVYNLTGNSIKVLNATSDCYIQFEDTTQDPINLLFVDEIKLKFKKFYLSNVGIKNQSIKIIVSENFNFNDRVSIPEYINSPNIQVINISNPEPNVQVELDLSNLNFSEFNDTGSNIRINDENNNPLPFYLVNFNKITKTGKLYFKTPNSIINSAIIHPDSLDAPSVSDGNATFEFFDDFKGTAIDNTKWNIFDATGWSVIDGELRGSDTTGRLLSHSLFSDGIILEIKSRTVTLASQEHTIGGFWVSTSNGFTISQHAVEWLLNNGSWDRIDDVVPDGNIDFLLQFTTSPIAVNLKITRLDTNIVTHDVEHMNVVENEPIMLGRRGDNFGVGNSYIAYWDWVRVRRVTAATAMIV